MLIKERLRKILYHKRRNSILKSIVNKASYDFTFLVSFPKSGNSWVRFILANFLAEDQNEEITFKNLHKYVPDSHMPGHLEALDDENYMKLPVHILKSHDSFSKFFRGKKVIYLVREGKAAIQSYYHYKNSRRIEPYLASEFIQPQRADLQDWQQHLLSWKNASGDILIVKYEDLKNDPFVQVRRILEFIGLEYTDDKIHKAIEMSSFDRMKAIESKGYYHDNRVRKSKETNFVRQAAVGVNEGIFSDEQLKHFEKRSLQAYKAFGYETKFLY